MLTGPKGRNTGMKAVFGGAVKKPLMTKVSMRHLNEIVRERNQYSRDAMEAWQDFINLKGRMDMDLSKVTKRNNFLVEELESWKQQVIQIWKDCVICPDSKQFLKFQAFAEQLTKETQDLKVKIESHKRENRRITSLLDQQKDDAARLTLRLSGTERQRDDALEALIMQQEVAEELERERKRISTELTALQHTNTTIVRQRDESQRVVLHLRSLINGQTHHMEHIVRSLNEGQELSNYVGEGYEDVSDGDTHGLAINGSDDQATKNGLAPAEESQRSHSRASTIDGTEAEKVTPEMETSLYGSFHGGASKRSSRLSLGDVADRHLRDKTDAIADIIRNISEQCAAAVEGLQLAHDADEDGDIIDEYRDHDKSLGMPDEDREHSRRNEGSEMGASENDSSLLNPSVRNSSIPPTPDLVHNRSSTSMSGVSESTGRDRASGHYSTHSDSDIKVVDDNSAHENQADTDNAVSGIMSKTAGADVLRPATARLVQS